MKQEIKIILIGAVTTLLVLGGIIFAMYKISESKNKNDNNSKEVKEEASTLDNTSSNVVAVYIFKKEGCPHCANALEFFNNIKDDYSMELVVYEVSEEDNRELMQLVAKELDLGSVTSVPFIIIGDFSLKGYSAARDETLKEQITKFNKDNNYTDVVKKVLNENPDLKIKESDLAK